MSEKVSSAVVAIPPEGISFNAPFALFGNDSTNLTALELSNVPSGYFPFVSISWRCTLVFNSSDWLNAHYYRYGNKTIENHYRVGKIFIGYERLTDPLLAVSYSQLIETRSIGLPTVQSIFPQFKTGEEPPGFPFVTTLVIDRRVGSETLDGDTLCISRYSENVNLSGQCALIGIRRTFATLTGWL